MGGNMKVIDLDEKKFKKMVIDDKEEILVDFYADWCGPCRMLGPIMDEISKDVTVYKVNTDNEAELSREYGIMSIPCIVAFRNGKELNRSVGLQGKEDILSLLK